MKELTINELIPILETALNTDKALIRAITELNERMQNLVNRVTQLEDRLIDDLK